ncbi:hypothetical protein ACSBR1_017699 [Camellia fascicularis]
MASSAVFLLLLLPLFPVVLAISKFDCHVDLTNSTLLAQKDINSSWVSPSGDFAFGFQQAEPSNDGNILFLLAIWFDKIPDKTMVWSANGVPTREGSKVTLTKDGGLRLFDHQGNVIWRAATNVTGSESSCVAMLDTGNFVVLNGDSNPIWESFKDPDDTILPGQILGTNQKLWSRLSETNYSDGRFQLRMQDDGNLVLYVASVSIQVNYGAYWATGILQANSNPQLIFDESGRHIYVKQGNQNVYNFTHKNMGSKQDFYHMARINFDGVFRLYNHPRRTSAKSDGSCSLSWSVVQHIPGDVCSVIQGILSSGACGCNSYCSVDTDGKPECFCPEAYPTDIQKGCNPNFPLPNCQEDGWETNPELIEFKELKNTDWPLGDYDLQTGPEVDKETCIQFCLDCFCAAVVHNGNLCYKKKFPLTHGMKTKNLNRSTLMKVSWGNL